MPEWVQRNIREILLFSLGAGSFVHEFLGAGERPFIVAASLALMGLPFFLASDKLVSRKSDERKAKDRVDLEATSLDDWRTRHGGHGNGEKNGRLSVDEGREQRIKLLNEELQRIEEAK